MNPKSNEHSAVTEQDYEYTAQGICITLMRTKPSAPSKKTPTHIRDQFHRHAWFELFYAEGGTQTLYFEEEQLCLHSGSFALVAPDALHYAEAIGDPLYPTVCSFSVRYREKGEAEARLASFLHFSAYRVFGADEFCALLMKNALSALASGNGVAAGSYLFSLLLRASDLCAIAELHDSASSDSQMGRVYKIEQNLYSRYTEEVPLSRLAEHLHLSERQLSRVFKKQYGVGYRTKKRELRMQSAARLLMRGEDIAKIAGAVGYRSQSAFYTAFKAYFGVSPALYKAQKESEKTERR